MLVIVDYGVGNLRSFVNLYSKCRISVEVASDPQKIRQATKLILPGVGHFGRGMENLIRSGLRPLIEERVLCDKVPILGVCLGMQLLTQGSEEGDVEGLGWIDARTVRISDQNGELRVPHVGFNSVSFPMPSPLFSSIDCDSYFYFTHSYKVVCRDESANIGLTDYGARFTSAVQSKNIFGTQFHPEKSHIRGVQIMKNFAEIV